jgi:hypothetical protein
MNRAVKSKEIKAGSGVGSGGLHGPGLPGTEPIQINAGLFRSRSGGLCSLGCDEPYYYFSDRIIID